MEMLDINNINKPYNKYKPILINLLVNYYGLQYNEMINKKINDVYIDFSSTPKSDYDYFLYKVGHIPEEIYNRYNNYHIVERQSRQIHKELLMKYLIDKLAIKDYNKIDYKRREFLSLFIDENFSKDYINFNNGYIDSYDAKNLNALSDNSIPNSIKESILNDQKKVIEILNLLEIDIDLSGNILEEIDKYRKDLEQKYKNYIAENSNYGKEMFNNFKNRFGLELSPDTIYCICSIRNPAAGHLYVYDNNNFEHTYNYIRMPITLLLNLGVKAIDVMVIHELIHQIEQNGENVGISIYDDQNTNNIANEIRTQIIAIKLAKQLHELGIFIYDNPYNYGIKGYCDYEYLFPLAYDFFNEYDHFIKECAINNTPNKLDECFGPYWQTYSKYLEDEYQKFLYYVSKDQVKSDFAMNAIASDLINNMKISYNKGRGKNV